MNPTIGHGKICYVELPSSDILRSAAFYSAVFGWKMRSRGDGATAFDDGVGQVSGAFVKGRQANTAPAGMLVYVMVDDAAATIQSLQTHGGQLVQAIGADAPEITARFRDPDGNLWGLYQEPAKPPGA